jgi:hypothetical protein
MGEYIEKINKWVKNNPDKANLAFAFIFGFLFGALIF